MDAKDEIHTALKLYIVASGSKGTAATQTVDFLTRFNDYRVAAVSVDSRQYWTAGSEGEGRQVDKAVETAPMKLVAARRSKHHRQQSQPTPPAANDYGLNGKKTRSTRGAGVLGTNRDFLMRMSAERRQLEKSLEVTQKQWGRLLESSGLSRSRDAAPQPALNASEHQRTWRVKASPRRQVPKVDCNSSYRRVLSTAMSSRRRRVTDLTWRSQLSESPTKRQQSEGQIDLSTCSVSQYISWFREHPQLPAQVSMPAPEVKITVKVSAPSDTENNIP